MTKGGIIRCILSLLLLAYLSVALVYAHREAAADTYKQLQVNIKDTQAAGFVTAEDIDLELDCLSKRISKIAFPDLNTLEIERKIMAMDKIEHANCVVLNNGTVRLDVTPLDPVARVFDINARTNYYINAQGKRMRASSRYRLDVPVITGYFNANRQPTYALPVVQHINDNAQLTALTSAIKVDQKGDILLIPRIAGHVVNLGDTSVMENKFRRLFTFYHKVMPVKGWEFYDTISVKWRGQVVAKRHNKRNASAAMPYVDEAYIDDPSTMLDSIH